MINEFRAKIQHHTKRALRILNGEVEMFPLTLHVEPMAGCNHDCVWCSERTFRRKYPGYLKTEPFKEVLRECAAGGTKSVTWVGSGEPTLHPDFSDLVEAAHQVGLQQGLITNGSRVPMKQLGQFNWIRVSLDAGSARAHKLLHLVDDYDLVLSNVRRMAESKETVVGVAFLCHEENVADLGVLIEKLDAWGVDYIQVKRLWSTDLYEALPLDVALGFKTKNLKVYDDVYNEGVVEGGNAGLPCWASSLHTVIAPTGDMFHCCRLANVLRDEEVHIGNLWEAGSFKAVWESPKRRAVVTKYLDPEETKRCPTCWVTPMNIDMDKLRKASAEVKASVDFI